MGGAYLFSRAQLLGLEFFRTVTDRTQWDSVPGRLLRASHQKPALQGSGAQGTTSASKGAGPAPVRLPGRKQRLAPLVARLTGGSRRKMFSRDLPAKASWSPGLALPGRRGTVGEAGKPVASRLVVLYPGGGGCSSRLFLFPQPFLVQACPACR